VTTSSRIICKSWKKSSTRMALVCMGHRRRVQRQLPLVVPINPILDTTPMVLLHRHRNGNSLGITCNILRYSLFPQCINDIYLRGRPYIRSSLHLHHHINILTYQRQTALIVVRIPTGSVSVANVLCLIVPIGLYRVGCASGMVPSVKRVHILGVQRM